MNYLSGNARSSMRYVDKAFTGAAQNKAGLTHSPTDHPFAKYQHTWSIHSSYVSKTYMIQNIANVIAGFLIRAC